MTDDTQTDHTMCRNGGNSYCISEAERFEHLILSGNLFVLFFTTRVLQQSSFCIVSNSLYVFCDVLNYIAIVIFKFNDKEQK